VNVQKSPTCPTCRGPLPEREPGAPGRPATFCGPWCRRMAALEIARIDRRIGRLESRHRDALIRADGKPDHDDVRGWRAAQRREAAILARHIDAESERLRDLLVRIGTPTPNREDPR
jgi:hypothetical protein